MERKLFGHQIEMEKQEEILIYLLRILNKHSKITKWTAI